MITHLEVNETNNMIEHENLDVRTITLGISLLDCCDSDLEKLNNDCQFLQNAECFLCAGLLICQGFQIELVIKKQDFIVEVLGLVEPLCMSKQDIVSPDCDRIVRHFFHQIAPRTRKSDIV